MLRFSTSELYDAKKNYLRILTNTFAKKELPRLIRNELISILVGLANKEKKGKKSNFTVAGKRKGYNIAPYSDDLKMTINTGRRGRKNLTWVRVPTKSGNKFVPAGAWDGNKNIQNIGKVEDALLLRLLAEAQTTVKVQQKVYEESRGSVAKSWLDAAQKIFQFGDTDAGFGSPINKAKKKNGKPFISNIQKIPSATGYEVKGTITSPILKKSGGQYRFDLAVRRRMLFFKRALKKGFLGNAEFQRKYLKGVYVRRMF